MSKDVSVRTLTDLKTGVRGTVRELLGGSEFRARLAVLGLTAGAEVTAIQNYGRGPIIVLVRDTRVALGRGEALKVRIDIAED